MDKKKVVFQILDSYAEITITDQQDNIVFFEIGGKEYGCWYPEIDQDTSSPFIFVKNDTEYDKYHRHDKTGQSKRKPDGKHATQQSKTNRPRSANAD